MPYVLLVNCKRRPFEKDHVYAEGSEQAIGIIKEKGVPRTLFLGDVPLDRRGSSYDDTLSFVEWFCGQVSNGTYILPEKFELRKTYRVYHGRFDMIGKSMKAMMSPTY